MTISIENLISKEVDRRGFLKRVAIVGGGIVAAGPISAVLAACGSEDASTATVSSVSTATAVPDTRLTGTVKVLGWGDKLNDNVNDLFNKNTGGKALFTIFAENPEALAKIRQNKEAFDTVFIDGLWANTHYNAGTIVPIPFKDWDIYDEYFPEFADLAAWQVPGGQMAVPHAWSADAIAYNSKHVTKPDSLAELFDPKYEGKVALYDSFYRNILNFVPAVTNLTVEDMHAEKTLDDGTIEQVYDVPDAIIKQVVDLMIEHRGNFKMIWSDIDEITKALVNEDIWISIAGNYITQNALDAGSTDIEFVNPTAHGLMGWIDGQCVIKNEQLDKNPDLVWEWMKHYHSGEQQAEIIGNTWLASTSRRCLEILESRSEENKQRVKKLAARETGIVKEMSLLRPIARPEAFQDAWAEFLAAG